MDIKTNTNFPARHPKLARLLIILIVVLTAILVRLNVAVYGPTELDEKVYLRAAIYYARDIRAGNLAGVINSTFNNEHPAFSKLLYSTVLYFKPTDDTDLSASFQITTFPPAKFLRILTMRLISVFFGTLAVLVLCLVNPLAGLMLAVDTFAIKYTSVIYLEALPLFLSLLSIITFSNFLDHFRKTGRLVRNNLPWLVVSAAACGAAGASKYIYGVAGLSILLFALILALKAPGKFIPVIALWAAAAGLFFLICDPTLWPDPPGRLLKSLTYSVDYATGGMVQQFSYPFWQPLKWLALSLPQQNPAADPAYYTLPGNFPIQLDTLILCLALLGLTRLFKEQPLYFTWLALGIAFLLLWNTKWPQYILIVLPPLCLSASLGIKTAALWLAQKWSRVFRPVEQGR